MLNSLSGEAMERSLEVLKPFGRFLELGKRDFYLNRRIHLRPLRQNISYFAIDVDQLPMRRPDLARALLAEVSAALVEGAIRPLAHRIFSFGELDDAFRLMQSSGHIGKLVLVPDGNAGVRCASRRRSPCAATGPIWSPAASTGSALRRRAGWPRTAPARSRCSAAADRQRRGAKQGSQNSKPQAPRSASISGDVADRGSLGGVLDAIRANQPPLRGVVHAASAIDDGLAADIDVDPRRSDPAAQARRRDRARPR